MSEFRSDSTLLNRRVINLHLQRLSRAELCTPTLNGLTVLLKVLLLRLGNIPTKDQWDDEKLIFSAIVDHDDSDHDQFLVKYTRRYSKDAHEHLASHGFVPTLRQCVQVSAEWVAVIMDRSKYTILYGQNFSNVEQEKTRVRRKVNSVQVLHEEGHSGCQPSC